jgi:Putative restriction endonuclease
MHTSLVCATVSAMVEEDIRYVREVRPLDFPDGDPEWHMGETTEHQLLCEVLRDLLRMATRDQMVCSDQFVYFDAANPRRKCAPDAFVKLGTPWAPVKSWRTWERGVPELCIEVLSPDEFEKLTLEEKLARFLSMGVPEVIAFDPDGTPGERLLAWDRIQGDLIERKVEDERTPLPYPRDGVCCRTRFAPQSSRSATPLGSRKRCTRANPCRSRTHCKGKRTNGNRTSQADYRSNLNESLCIPWLYPWM